MNGLSRQHALACTISSGSALNSIKAMPATEESAASMAMEAWQTLLVAAPTRSRASDMKLSCVVPDRNWVSAEAVAYR